MSTTEISISLASAEDATRESIKNLAAMVNEVYATSEADLWEGIHRRTSESSLIRLMEAGQLFIAKQNEQIVGCVEVVIENKYGVFSMLTAAPALRGLGIGSKLVQAAENHVRENGREAMRLELLTPKKYKQKDKVFLHEWYTRIGYKFDFVADFADKHPDMIHRLATPCDFTVYRKML